jgi:hypothetical protein
MPLIKSDPNLMEAISMTSTFITASRGEVKTLLWKDLVWIW